MKEKLVDAVSATANNGFTTLGAISSRLNWVAELIDEAIEQCNKQAQVVIVSEIQPTLLLVPKTRADKSVIELIRDLVDASNELRIKDLRFTHYACLFHKLPVNEITEILLFLLNPNLKTSIEKIYWDIDSKFESEIKDIYNNIASS